MQYWELRNHVQTSSVKHMTVLNNVIHYLDCTETIITVTELFPITSTSHNQRKMYIVRKCQIAFNNTFSCWPVMVPTHQNSPNCYFTLYHSTPWTCEYIFSTERGQDQRIDYWSM